MKTTIDQLTNSIGEIKKSINNKYINQKEEAPINDTTLLSEYASLIDGIKTEVVDISQQIFVFYCYADSPATAKTKELPVINWDNSSKKWNIECKLGEWCTNTDDADQYKSDGTYLYAMFVSVNTNTSASNINWPDPVRLEGVPGKDGEKGDPGLDGILAGAVLRNISPVYIYSETIPERPTVSYDSGELSNLNPNNIKVNGKNLSENPTSNQNQDWSLNYSGAKNIWRIDVQYSSNSSEAIVLGDPVLITDTIQIDVKYSYSKDGDWDHETLTPSAENQTVYRKTTMVTDSGEEYETIDVASQYSKSITGVNYKYGTSETIDREPTEWNNYVPNTDKTIWAKRIETFSDNTTQTITYPIGLRGPAGIQYVSWVNDEVELEQVNMSGYSDDYIGKIAVKVKHDIYIWYGRNSVDIPGIQEVNSQYWLNIGSLAPIPDWNAKEGEDGYIENKTHYVETIIEIFGKDDDSWTQTYIPTSAFNITINNGSITKQWDDIWCISEESLPDGVSFEESINDTYMFDSDTDQWECSYQIIHQLDPKFVPQIIETSYLKLRSWRDNGKLIPGMKYRITDYKTTTIQSNTSSAGYPFDIIVTALDEKTLSEEACAIQNKSESYFNNRNLAAWKIWYSLDNKWWTSDESIELLNGQAFSRDPNFYTYAPIYKLQDGSYFALSDDLMWKIADRYRIETEDYFYGDENGPSFKERYENGGLLYMDQTPIPIIDDPTTIEDINGNTWMLLNLEGYDTNCWGLMRENNWINGQCEDIILCYEDAKYGYTIILTDPGKGIIYRMIDEFGNDFPFDFQNILIDGHSPISILTGVVDNDITVATFSPTVKNNVCKTIDNTIPFIRIIVSGQKPCSNNLFICSHDLELTTSISSEGNTFINCNGTYVNVNFCEFRSCVNNYAKINGYIILKDTVLQ